MLKKLWKELDQTGILMLTDPHLPSLTTIVAGQPVQGSWWGHPQGNLMYNLSHEVAENENILPVKFFDRKITFMDQRHWSALYAIATSEQDWQFKKLRPEHLQLFEEVKDKKELQADKPHPQRSTAETGKLAAKLEERLLLFSESVHTDSGKHARVLRTWKKQMSLRKFKPQKISYESATRHFEELLADLVPAQQPDVKLPWG